MNKMCAKPMYKCAICGEVYDSIAQRMKCEQTCLKKQEEEERKAAEAKKAAEYEARVEEVNIKFAKVRPDAVIPSKRDEDMGFDIYACFDEDYMVINAHETKLIPTGIASACDPGYGFLLFERGSTGSKGIARRCGVIDSGYRDEWFIGLTNTTDRDLYISKIDKEGIVKQQIEYFENKKRTLYKSDKEDPILYKLVEGAVCNSIIYPYSKAIVQAIVTPVLKTKEQELTYEDLKAIPSERGLGKLGSSNK